MRTLAAPPAPGIREIFLQIAGAFNQILGPLDHQGSIESGCDCDAEEEAVLFEVDRAHHHLGAMNQICSHYYAHVIYIYIYYGIAQDRAPRNKANAGHWHS